ncbi:serine/threonine-protein kinase [Actinomadura hibisca]|uniref:serine/threonine-protein kinase n=1 Tax=Actinomadura hibisca TaxID=68565 RepID=UPI000830CAA9|nr:serine/threonine-protein kinase [Actinomadura hibisca]
MPEAAPLEPGDPRELGRYRVVGRLGAGGQGAVFLGQDEGGRYVAVKLLHAQMAADPAARARFIREVSAARRVEAFCTAQVLEADVQGDQPYVVSEFIDGPSLHDVIAHNGPFGAAELERLAIGTVTALTAIHEAGIVHRDFKPNNVMLAADGPRVVDFGIARTVNSQESAVTATGMVVGTPGYLAPEQLTGAPLTPAVDIFAWGATMVFAATGQSPFEADTLPVIINKILNEEPDLSRLPAGPLRDLIGRCLSKDAGLRPPAAQLLLHLLGAAGVEPGHGGDSEDLLNQGTRVAAQLPVPTSLPSRPQPRSQQPITPPPMPMAGHHTPPPPQQQITPPPMAMYQGGMPPQGPPQGQPTHGMPPGPPPQQQPMGMQGRPPQYGPPPQRSGSNPGLAIGIGCGVLVLVAVLVIVVLAVIGANTDDEPDYTPPTLRTPTLGTGRIDVGFIGVWDGTGSQPDAGTGRTSFRVKFAIVGSSGTATYTYPSGTATCITRLSLSSGSYSSGSTKVEYREQPLTTANADECAAGYLTFTRVSTSSRVARWEWRSLSSSTTQASGLVSKP